MHPCILNSIISTCQFWKSLFFYHLRALSHHLTRTDFLPLESNQTIHDDLKKYLYFSWYCYYLELSSNSDFWVQKDSSILLLYNVVKTWHLNKWKIRCSKTESRIEAQGFYTFQPIGPYPRHNYASQNKVSDNYSP